jgi:hypothetical protein
MKSSDRLYAIFRKTITLLLMYLHRNITSGCFHLGVTNCMKTVLCDLLLFTSEIKTLTSATYADPAERGILPTKLLTRTARVTLECSEVVFFYYEFAGTYSIGLCDLRASGVTGFRRLVSCNRWCQWESSLTGSGVREI